MKKCKRCGSSQAKIGGNRLICEDCLRQQVYDCRNARKALDPEAYKETVFNNRLWSMYRIRRDQYDAFLTAQNEVCAACSEPNSNKKGWHVDHDHSCCPGERSCGLCVRGLLCNGCNAALGHVKDDVTRLMSLANYIATAARIVSVKPL